MLLSLALIFTLGLILAEGFKKLHLPHFIGMIVTGAILGPYAFDLIDDSILNISSELRQIALIVILVRAGLNLDLQDLKKIGRPAILLSFIPATLEIIAIMIWGPLLFGLTYLEAAFLATILAAVSPAVIVPKMIHLMEMGYGKAKRIPHMIMASASVDDIYVIVLFSIVVKMYQTGHVGLTNIFQIPLAILFGILIGVVSGVMLSKLFAILRVRDTIKVLLVLACAFFIITLENVLQGTISMSGLLAVMVLGITFLNQSKERALRLQIKLSKVWVFAELVLFVLVGAAVNLSLAFSAGLLAIVLLVFSLMSRLLGVGIALTHTDLNYEERLFSGIAFLPKATVQAAIGAIPLSLGVPNGDLILAIAVLSIIITAPLGALGIDITKDSLLQKKNI
ncbi:MAG: cation:proton antiporter [Candidatus Izemoplasma sp.]|nr:cation:proton antiporter [Candidatus Izemoplasma sp.]